MTAAPSLDPARFLNEHLTTASPDLLRELLGEDDAVGAPRRIRGSRSGSSPWTSTRPS